MSTTPSIPVLRGGGAVLRHEDDALTLRRRDEEILIPLPAVRDVIPDGRAVTVELRVPAGGTPVTYRIVGVTEAAADLFAVAVGTAVAALPEPDPSFDGASLVTTRSLRVPSLSAVEKAKGIAALVIALGPGVVTLILSCVLVVMKGEAGLLFLSIPMGLVIVCFNVASAGATYKAFQMWLLPRHAITVMAVRTSPYSGRSAKYEYTDASGQTHSCYRGDYASQIEISYHPDSPGHPFVVRHPLTRVAATIGTLLLWAFTAGLIFATMMAANE
ncbi:hypothetical protein ACFV9E_39015 [Streptomyces sp. NPDC059835]|uniref:hypothetical protein n=1 Tax=Streptomyces sp. NPDC059835 TaxID=3346967 RepID=UPI003668C983